ncbi:MAG: hypothetical protein BWK79_13195 [Beggiatoa sp. IS2]|nr:MAG: hypothetical protein BWK79_13195 [Beggiatoa sp. IS2]
MSRYLNPYTDFGFKKLFGEEGSKDLLIDFLNQLLPAHHQIAALQLKNTENLPDIPLERRAIFDIACTSITGERFIVEMQKAKHRFFKDRALFYATFPIREQAEKGEWNFKLSPVYFIAILDFIYDEQEERRKFRRDVALKDQDGEIFFDLYFKFLQMPLFDKTEPELTSHFDKWLYFLKHLVNLEHIPQILNEPIFQKAFQVAELANLSREQLTTYEQNLLNYWSTQGVIDTAREDGRQEGRQKGRQEGELQKALEIAQRLKTKGFSLEDIGQMTGLTQEQLSLNLNSSD